MSPKASKAGPVDLESFGGLQLALYHETPEDAARALGEAYQDLVDPRKRGIKELAHRLCPTLPPDKAHRWFLACVNDTRNEKFSGSEWLALMKIGREQGVHTIANHFNVESGYEYRVLAGEVAEKRARKNKIAYHLAEAARLSQEGE
jgi:hypothetical protein